MPHRKNEDSPNWIGDEVKISGAYMRAARLYQIDGPCHVCGVAAQEKHHVDGNPRNNDKENVILVCRSCHRQLDQRNTGRHYKPAKPCIVCGRLSYRLAKGRCKSCDSYFRLYGRDERLTKRREEIGK